MYEKEYIERNALKNDGHSCWHDGKGNVYYEIDHAPAADVAPVVHARWKDNHCTACGMMPMGEELWDSCEFAPPKFEYFMDFGPNCGARMDGGKHETD